jgi:orotidine-5'-phosphate decarboxylase
LPLDGKHLSDNLVKRARNLKRTHIYGVKVGLEMFTSEGPSSVEKLKKDGWTVFLDLKLHDIPNTVQAAADKCWKYRC